MRKCAVGNVLAFKLSLKSLIITRSVTERNKKVKVWVHIKNEKFMKHNSAYVLTSDRFRRRLSRACLCMAASDLYLKYGQHTSWNVIWLNNDNKAATSYAVKLKKARDCIQSV
jgi:hypothetical protein